MIETFASTTTLPIDGTLLGLILLIFIVAGMVKGIIGLGLPSVALALLTLSTDLTNAMALLIVPSLVTNVWQAARGKYLSGLLQECWLFFLIAALGIILGGLWFSYFKVDLLAALLGFLLLAYALASMAGFSLTLRVENKLAASAFGSINGVLTGLTGSFVVPGVIYLQSLTMPRDKFIQAMGILFSVSTLVLLATLLHHDRFDQTHLRLSSIGVIPAIAGMTLGQWIRPLLSDSTFKLCFFASLAIIGSWLMARSHI